MTTIESLKKALLNGESPDAGKLLGAICKLEVENVQLRKCIARTMIAATYSNTVGGLASFLHTEHAQLAAAAATALAPQFAEGQIVNSRGFTYQITAVAPNFNGTGHNAYGLALISHGVVRFEHQSSALEESLTLAEVQSVAA